MPLAHELGHYGIAKLVGFKTVNMEFSKILKQPKAIQLETTFNDYIKMSYFNFRLFLILLAGPIIGYISIIITYLLVQDIILLYLYTLYYIMCCRSDIYKLIYLILHKNRHVFTIRPESINDCDKLNCDICDYNHKCDRDKGCFKYD